MATSKSKNKGKSKTGKTLVVFYTRTGVTCKVAQLISKALNCDVEEIIDKKDRTGATGYILGGRDAMKKTLTELKSIKHKPNDCSMLIIGTPVWA
jgi:hypothetical protein